MSLFRSSKPEPLKLNPYLILTIAVIYVMASDGEIDEEELGQLQSIVAGDEHLFKNAVTYVKSNELEHFLAEAAPLVDDSQRLCVLTNMADSLLANGKADPEELKLFHKALIAFGWSVEDFSPYFDTIAVKNDHSILGHH